RFLDQAELRIAGRRIQSEPCGTAATDHLAGRALVKLPRTSLSRDDQDVADPQLEVQTDWRISDGVLLRHCITNRNARRVRFPISWRITADFVDQGQAHVRDRKPRVPVKRRWTDGDTLLLEGRYPGLCHSTRIRFRGLKGLRPAGDRVLVILELEAQAQCVIELEVTPLFDPAHAAELPLIVPDDEPEPWQDGCSRLVAGDAAVQAAWDTAVSDLRTLQLGDGHGEERFTPAAGIPHYLALFGRDALMTGWQSALLNPATMRGALSLVGRWTADAIEPKIDAQPGRVLHQRELGPMALLGKNPFLRYYGDHTAAPLWLLGLADAFARNGDHVWFLGLKDQALRILDWMDRYGDRDGDGLYEYKSMAGPWGLKNHGWKDSNEAIVYPDGRIVPDPIVVCEIQAIFAAARQAMAEAFRAAGDSTLPKALAGQALQDRKRLEETMWMPDEGFLALGLDPDKQQIRTLASNAGESLAYGALSSERAREVADRLMTPEFFTGWGIRTLSERHPAFNPLGYHLGSVWPCFTALTARGFARYGFDEHLHALARGLFDATELFERRRMPELFGGHARQEGGPGPGLYPDACWPQAWSSGAIILLVDTLVGLKPAAPHGAAVIEPRLPSWLPDVKLRNVGLGQGSIDLRVRRRGGEMVCEELANTSGLRLYGPGLGAPSPESGATLEAYIQSLP
ncbi:MAG TPA: glycogen debranching N-terminal domain-containing protein, partial [Caulobacteraceae bacterium]|nr:glycogen debranching N-terminal domain-containing protein [Caulobacteraceae bacterium]